jgi:hypothetical protein
VSKGVHRGGVYEINDIIINLRNPILTDEAKENVLELINDVLDPEGRDVKNLFKLMIEDGVMYVIPGGENGYLNFMEPFMKLIKNEKLKIKNKKQ